MDVIYATTTSSKAVDLGLVDGIDNVHSWVRKEYGKKAKGRYLYNVRIFFCDFRSPSLHYFRCPLPPLNFTRPTPTLTY